MVSEVILIRADAEDKWRTHCLISLPEREEGDKRGQRRAVTLMVNRDHQPHRREEKSEWIRGENTLTSLSPFFFLV